MNLKLILDICNKIGIDAENVNIDSYLRNKWLCAEDSFDDHIYIESDSYLIDEYDVFLNIKILNNNLISKLNQCFVFNDTATDIYMCYGKDYKSPDGDIIILSEFSKFASFSMSNKTKDNHYVENVRIYNVFNNLNIKYDDAIFKQALKNYSDINNEQFDLSLSNFVISKNSFKYSVVTKFLRNLELLS